MSNKKTTIILSEEDRHWLKNYSKANKVSVAEAIRQGIHRLKESRVESNYHAVVQNTQGLWEKGDGLKYQKDMRSEWES